jgi:hypothetical protein
MRKLTVDSSLTVWEAALVLSIGLICFGFAASAMPFVILGVSILLPVIMLCALKHPSAAPPVERQRVFNQRAKIATSQQREPAIEPAQKMEQARLDLVKELLGWFPLILLLSAIPIAGSLLLAGWVFCMLGLCPTFRLIAGLSMVIGAVMLIVSLINGT